MTDRRVLGDMLGRICCKHMVGNYTGPVACDSIFRQASVPAHMMLIPACRDQDLVQGAHSPEHKPLN